MDLWKSTWRSFHRWTVRFRGRSSNNVVLSGTSAFDTIARARACTDYTRPKALSSPHERLISGLEVPIALDPPSSLRSQPHSNTAGYSDSQVQEGTSSNLAAVSSPATTFSASLVHSRSFFDIPTLGSQSVPVRLMVKARPMTHSHSSNHLRFSPRGMPYCKYWIS